MRDVQQSGKIGVHGMYGAYVGDTAYSFDGIDVLPVSGFLERLADGEIF